MSRVKSLLTACFTAGEHAILRQNASKHDTVQSKVQLEAQCADFSAEDCFISEVGRDPFTQPGSAEYSLIKISSVGTSGRSSTSYLTADDGRGSKRTGSSIRTSDSRSHLSSRKHSIAASTICNVSVQTLAVGTNGGEVTMNPASDTDTEGGTLGSFHAGSFSPFHSAAAVPFRSRQSRDDVIVVITNTTHTTTGGGGIDGGSAASGGGLNHSAEQSAATPFDFCASVTTTRHGSLASSIATAAAGPCAKLGRHDTTFSPHHRNCLNQHKTHCHDHHSSHAYPLLKNQPLGSAFTCSPLPLLDSNYTIATPSLAHGGSVPISFPHLLASGGVSVGVGGNTFRSLSGCSGDILETGSDMPTLPSGAMYDIAAHAMLLPSRTGSGATEISPPSLLLPMKTYPHLPPPQLQLSREDYPPSPFLSGSIALSPRMVYQLVAAGAGAAEAKATNNPADKFLRFDDLEKVCTELRDLSFVGSGASGNVYSGTWCGVPVAVKFMLSGDVGQLQRQQREAALSRLASHPHLVQTYAVAAAELAHEHFHPAPSADPRVSALSNGDLFSTCVAGGTAVDLYGMCCFSPSPSVVASCPCTLLPPPPAAAATPVAVPRTAGAASAASGRASAQLFGSKRGIRSCGGSGAAAATAGGAIFHCTTDVDYPLRNNRIAPSNNIVESAATAAVSISSGGGGGGGDSSRGALQKQGCVLCHHYRPHRTVGTGTPSVRGLCSLPTPISTVVVSDDLPYDGCIPSAVAAQLAAGLRVDHRPCTTKTLSRTQQQQPPWSSQRHSTPGGGEQLHVHAGGAAAAAAIAATMLAEGSQISSAEIEVSAAFQVEAKADSFVMTNQESANGLLLFQPSDVLAHIGARPGQWLTVVIMEEMDRGSLHQSIHGGIFHPSNSALPKRHWVRGIVRTLVEVAQGMAHLHSSELVHGDLKPANVLLKANSRDARGFIAKVSDFGVTRAVDSTSQDTVSTSEWGTVIYTAPEVFNGKAGMPSDVFSFGVLTWHLATGQLPHQDINPFAVMLAVSRGELELEWPPTVPKPLRKLGRMCMQHDPVARPTFSEIVRALLRYEDKMRQCSAAAASAASSITLGTGTTGSQPATPGGGGGGRR